MFGILQVGLLAMVLAGPMDAPVPVRASQPDSVATAPAPPPLPMTAQPKQKRVFYGGSIGMTFGNYTRFSVQPLVGYQFTPKLSGGVKGIYEYVKDKRYTPDLTASNYGGSLFSRLRFIPNAYAHAEFAYVSYEFRTASGGSERTGVPFLYLGGGLVQRLSPNASAYVEVLFDVLQDSNSPYDNWQPFVSVGVMAGF
jgi:hypothetical protein